MPRYFFADRGVSRGPFELDQIVQSVQTGEIESLTLMWRDGMDHWATAEQVLIGTGLFKYPGTHTAHVAPHTDLDLQPADAPVIAAYGRRFAATLIDALVMFLPLLILNALPRAFLPDAVSTPIGGLLSVIALFAYYTLLQGRAEGASVGKRAVEIRVVRDDGGKLGDALALGRYTLLALFSLLLLPCLVPLLNRHRRGLHDMICGTLVLEGKSDENPAMDFSDSVVGGWGTTTWVMAGVSLLVPLAAGIVATLSIPAYQEYVVQSKVSLAIEEARDASEKMVEYRSEHGHWPLKPADIGLPNAAEIADVATMHLDGEGTVALTFTSDFIRGRALHIRIGEDGHRQCTTNLPRKFIDRACSRASLSPTLASAAPTL
jgi:uncharacterized RDD family membrane protein YckC